RSKRDWSSDVCSSDLTYHRCSGSNRVPCPPAAERGGDRLRAIGLPGRGTPGVGRGGSTHPGGRRPPGTPQLRRDGRRPTGGFGRSEERRVGKEWRWGG